MANYLSKVVINNTEALIKDSEARDSIHNLENLQHKDVSNCYTFYTGSQSSYTPDTRVQGCCIAHGYLYTYETSGVLRRYDFSNNTVNTITNVNLYHGNALSCIGDSIFAASSSISYEGNNDTNKTLMEYNLSTGSVTRHTLFNDTSMTGLFAVARLDDSTLICGLTNGTKIYELYKVDIHTWNKTQLTIVNAPITSNFTYLQGMSCYNSKLYILTSWADQIFVYNIADNTCTFDKIIKIPAYCYHSGVFFGEIEDLDFGYLNGVGYTGIMVSSEKQTVNNINSYYTKFWLIGKQAPAINPLLASNYSGVPWINANYTGFIEYGSDEYPFKSISTGIEFFNAPQIYHAYNAMHIMPGYYHFERTLHNARTTITALSPATATSIFIDGVSQIGGSLNFDSNNSTNHIIAFTGDIILRDCIINLNVCTITNMFLWKCTAGVVDLECSKIGVYNNSIFTGNINSISNEIEVYSGSVANITGKDGVDASKIKWTYNSLVINKRTILA